MDTPKATPITPCDHDECFDLRPFDGQRVEVTNFDGTTEKLYVWVPHPNIPRTRRRNGRENWVKNLGHFAKIEVIG